MREEILRREDRDNTLKNNKYERRNVQVEHWQSQFQKVLIIAAITALLTALMTAFYNMYISTAFMTAFMTYYKIIDRRSTL